MSDDTIIVNSEELNILIITVIIASEFIFSPFLNEIMLKSSVDY